LRTLFLLVFLTAALSFAQESPERAHAETGAKHGEAAQEEEHEPSIWWKWANFAILAGGIGYLVAKNAGPFFRARGEEIQRGIAEAAKVRQEAEARAAEIESRIANLSGDIENLRAKSKQEIAAEMARLQADTEAQLAKIQAHAEAEIALATKHASLELKAYSAQLALAIAEKQITQKLDDTTQRDLNDVFIRDLQSERSAGSIQ
jgi:F-type H+-transporting ATPase subunit b